MAFEGTGYYDNINNWEQNVLYINNCLINARFEISGNYSIKSGTKTIAVSAFFGCESLTSITVPDSVTSIGDGAFSYCSSLSSITIPDSVTRINSSVFWGCTSLMSVTIPNSVTYIDSDAFSGCSNVVIYGSAGSYAEAFAENNGITFVNSDKRVDIRDLIRLKKRIAAAGENVMAEKDDPDDIDKNGFINASDIAALRKILLGVALG